MISARATAMTRTEVSAEFVHKFLAKPGIRVKSAWGPDISHAAPKRLRTAMLEGYPQLRTA